MLANKKTQRKAKCLTAILLAVCLAVLPYFALTASAENEVEPNESALSELQRKNDELSKALEEAKKDTENQAAQSALLKEKIAVVQQQIDESNAEIERLNAKIAEKSGEMSSTQAEVDKSYDLLKQRLRAIYMAGETSVLDIVLGATDFSDFLDKVEIVRTVSKHDTELIEKLKKTIVSVESEKAAVEQVRLKTAQAKAESDARRTELAQLEAESNTVLNQMQAKQNSVIKDLDENSAEQQAIEAELTRYYEEQQRLAQEEERARQAAEESSKNSSSSGNTDSSTPGADNPSSQNPSGGSSSSEEPGESKGFVWPVIGFTNVTSEFGDMEDRTSPHKGMDIASYGIYGAPVVAVADGKVFQSSSDDSYAGGCGNYVAIDHGGAHYITRYLHMSRVVVSTGDYVKQGQVIGYVGNTGDSYGAHLHFDVRLDNVYINPRKLFN